MKKFVTTLSAAAIAAGVALGSAPLAAAEVNPVDGFYSDVSAAGLTVSKKNEQTVLMLGLVVCVDKFSGGTVEDEIQNVMETTKIPRAYAAKFVSAALTNLCPKALSAGTVN